MKNKKSIKIITVILFCFLLGLTSIEAQNNSVMQSLTETQQQLLKEQRELVVMNREVFKASLTEEQLTILDNSSLTKQEKIRTLTSTFTADQKALMAKNKASIEALKEAFKNTITANQREHMQSHNMSRMHDTNNHMGGHKKDN